MTPIAALDPGRRFPELSPLRRSPDASRVEMMMRDFVKYLAGLVALLGGVVPAFGGAAMAHTPAV